MEPHQFCPLCSVGIRGYETHVDELPPDYAAEHWFEEIRVLLPEAQEEGRATGGLFLSGVGYLTATEDDRYAHVPLDRNESYKDVDPDSLEEIDVFPGTAAGYAIHDSCWKLLRAKLANIENDAHIIRALFNYLYTTPLTEDRDAFQHDDNIVFTQHDPPEHVLKLDHGRSSSEPPEQYTDPSDILPMDEIQKVSPGTFSYPKYWLPSQENTANPTTWPDGSSLFGLPLELIFHIFSYLPLTQVMHMRRVCRSFAQIASWDNLPQSFWKSRFMLGHELGFVLPDLAHARDWAKLFRGVQSLLKYPQGVLYHRRRVWEFMERIGYLASVEGSETRKLLGHEVSVDEKWKEGLPWGDRVLEYKGWYLKSGELALNFPPKFMSVSCLSGRLAEGDCMEEATNDCCVAVHHRITQFPSQVPSVSACEIGVSMIQVGQRTYISGIRYRWSGSQENAPTSLGFRNLSDEKIIEISPGANIEAVYVAFVPRGLVGIKFSLAGGDPASDWIGQKEGANIAYGVLKPPKQFDQYYLVANLDPYKVVSLELVHPTTEIGSAQNKQIKETCLLHDQYMSYIWTPTIPKYHNLFLSPLKISKPARSDALFNFDFGGPRGEMLASLTRIVLHMSFRWITGMELFYDDRESIMIGNPGAELSFVIDGPGGERITDVEVATDTTRFGVVGLKLFTSHGRNKLLASMRTQISGHRRFTKLTRLELPAGHAITGFTAVIPEDYVQLDYGQLIEEIGLQGQPQDARIVTRQPTDDQVHPVYPVDVDFEYRYSAFPFGGAEENMDFSNSASLIGVRRIRVSRGISSRSRLPHHVSGLMFEYHDQRTPSIVGQWMDEFDSMDLAHDEALRGISVMVRPEGIRYMDYPDSPDDEKGFDSYFGPPGGHIEEGPVFAIHIETTHGQHKMLIPPGRKLPPFYACKVSQYYRAPQEEFTWMLWVFEKRFDRVRVFTGMKNSRKPPILIPRLKPPFDEVQRFYLEQTLDDGTKDKLDAIVANFQQEYIRGLMFYYRSGEIRHIGDGTGVKLRKEIRFQDHDRIVGFSRTIEGGGGMTEFTVFSKPENDSPAKYILTNGVAYDDDEDELSIEPIRPRHCSWIMDETDRGTAYAMGISPNGMDGNPIEAPGGVELRKPHGTDFVGFYVSCDEFLDMGALCRPIGT
ncbi:hypothetical protein FQN54_002987 [Arachnomyces sp. PD_36]|nr:hypothetical protein FQN54_002987 [Arachnomyces sp. PD_36]